jgi:uncharacterized protein
MHPLVNQHQNAISELCQQYCMLRLEVFGSAARSVDYDPQSSDADFLVEFSPSAEAPSLKEFFGFQTELSQILGRSVDLAEISAIRNPYLQASINPCREVVYAA